MRTIAVFFLRIAYILLRAIWYITRPITVGVRVMMIQDGQVVLVHHTYQNAWFLPGGAVKRGETLEQAACREAWEETGASINKIIFIGTYTSFVEGKTDHISLFLSENFVLPEIGAQKAHRYSEDYEISQVKAFPLDHLPGTLAAGHGRRIDEYTARNGRVVTALCGEW